MIHDRFLRGECAARYSFGDAGLLGEISRSAVLRARRPVMRYQTMGAS